MAVPGCGYIDGSLRVVAAEGDEHPGLGVLLRDRTCCFTIRVEGTGNNVAGTSGLPTSVAGAGREAMGNEMVGGGLSAPDPAATALRARSKAAGNCLSRLTARRSIPAQAFGLK